LLPAPVLLLLLLLLLCSYRFNARASNRGWRLDYFLVRMGTFSHVTVHLVFLVKL
jgi:hypothetical protein